MKIHFSVFKWVLYRVTELDRRVSVAKTSTRPYYFFIPL